MTEEFIWGDMVATATSVNGKGNRYLKCPLLAPPCIVLCLFCLLFSLMFAQLEFPWPWCLPLPTNTTEHNHWKCWSIVCMHCAIQIQLLNYLYCSVVRNGGLTKSVKHWDTVRHLLWASHQCLQKGELLLLCSKPVFSGRWNTSCAACILWLQIVCALSFICLQTPWDFYTLNCDWWHAFCSYFLLYCIWNL